MVLILPMLGQQQPCNPPPGKCKTVDDCQGLDHQSCPGNWGCKKQPLRIFGEFKYTCQAKDGYCNTDADCDAQNLAEPVCEQGHFVCRDWTCQYDCEQEVTDRDNDGIANADDSCPDDPFNDQDHDGICVDQDNCPTEPNPDQKDSNTDGTGVACDPDFYTSGGMVGGIEQPWLSCRMLTRGNTVTYQTGTDAKEGLAAGLFATGGPWQEESYQYKVWSMACIRTKCQGTTGYHDGRDLDGDHVHNESDNCMFTPNTTQQDADLDGVGDACDDNNNLVDPEQDANGIDRGWEVWALDSLRLIRKDTQTQAFTLRCLGHHVARQNTTSGVTRTLGLVKAGMSGSVCRVRTTSDNLHMVRGGACAGLPEAVIRSSDDKQNICAGSVGDIGNCPNCKCGGWSDAPVWCCPIAVYAGLRKGRTYRIDFDIMEKPLPWFDQVMGGPMDAHSIAVRVGNQGYGVLGREALDRVTKPLFKKSKNITSIQVTPTGDFQPIEFCMWGFGEYWVDNIHVIPLGGE